MSWILRNGRFIVKGGPEDIRTPVTRSDLPAPMVISDHIPDLVNAADGKHYESKSALRKSYKAHGVRELGNDPVPESKSTRPLGIKSDVIEAVQKVRQGYKPRPETERIETTPTTGVEWSDYSPA